MAYARRANSEGVHLHVLGRMEFTWGPVEMAVFCAAGTGTTTRRRAATTTSVFVERPGVFDGFRSGMTAITVAGSVSQESEPGSGSLDMRRRETNVLAPLNRPTQRLPGSRVGNYCRP